MKEVRGVGARIEAGDHEQAQVGEDDGTVVAAGGGEGSVGSSAASTLAAPGWPGLVNSNPLARPIPESPGVTRVVSCWVLMVFGLLSLGGSCQLCAAAVVGVPSAGTSGVSSRLVVGWAGSSASAITPPAAAMPAAT